MLENIRYAFFGALIFQVAFMFILYLQHQRKHYYIFYALYMLGILLAMEPRILQLRHEFVFLVEWPAVLMYFLFLDAFLGLSGASPHFKRFIQHLMPVVLGFILIQFVLTVAKEFLWDIAWADQWADWLGEFFYYLAFPAGVYSIYETYRLKGTLSKYILAGIFFLLVGVFLNKMFYEAVGVVPVIIGAFLELLLFSAAIGYKANLVESEKRKTQEQFMQVSLMALRDQMRPHFVANCLNSIKLLIQQQKEKEAIDYLTEFSKLHRLIVEHFQDLKISLKKELDICRSYLEMEKLRFKQSFNYEFDIAADDNLLSFVEIPPLLFQPIIENAIWHGLIKKEGEKNLGIRIRTQDSCLRCIIEDNGVGRPGLTQNGALAVRNNPRKSTGLSNTLEKIKIFNALYHTRLEMELIDKHDEEGRPDGFKVVFTIFYD
ncbi:MAG: histidine kinase [Phaeodactylibacter sp.]|nr:histidine kinase [Phaeodactylibacter sp.]MCB9049660.1 histidine kinase [Lewinellaceae bacterium]